MNRLHTIIITYIQSEKIILIISETSSSSNFYLI